MILDFLIGLTAGHLIWTKLADCTTTLHGVTAASESNQFAARMMRRFGVQRTVWAVFAVVCTIVAAATYVAVTSDHLAMKVVYVVLGNAIAIIQGAVAHTNMTHRWNAITRAVLYVHVRGWRR
jgi:hypothetical protein